MYKKLVVVSLMSLMMVLTFSCKKGKKEGGLPEATKKSAAEEVVVVKAEFEEMVNIFKGFEEVVKKNKDNPSTGVKECQSYVEKNIPKIKSLEAKIKKHENSSDYIDQLMKTNDEIKNVGESVKMIINESYGVQGADVLMQLSDMALARL